MSPAARRADAVLNRERIVEAARAELGASNGAVSELKLHVVAKAAGVGQGTLYRNFPSREHLAAAVYEQELTELVEAVPELLERYGPTEAFPRWLARLLEYARVKRGVVAALEASAWQELYDGNHDRLDLALTRLLEAGREAGAWRPDVDAADVILLLGALSRIPPDEWRERSQRVVEVVVDGVRLRDRTR